MNGQSLVGKTHNEVRRLSQAIQYVKSNGYIHVGFTKGPDKARGQTINNVRLTRVCQIYNNLIWRWMCIPLQSFCFIL